MEYLMDYLNYKIICEPEEPEEPLKVFGNEDINGGIIVRSSVNSQTLYIDGTSESAAPVYIGITKSRGNQKSKLPVEAGDVLGGLQIYARATAGTQLGYNQETPLVGSLIYRMSDKNSTELLIATKNDNELSVKLILDSKGNLRVTGTIKTGELEITDQSVEALGDPVIFVKVKYQGIDYAMPLYQIL
jgi:hypothetical protein